VQGETLEEDTLQKAIETRLAQIATRIDDLVATIPARVGDFTQYATCVKLATAIAHL
jgi:hypothetical protein